MREEPRMIYRSRLIPKTDTDEIHSSVADAFASLKFILRSIDPDILGQVGIEKVGNSRQVIAMVTGRVS
jgi:hypothetical protein